MLRPSMSSRLSGMKTRGPQVTEIPRAGTTEGCDSCLQQRLHPVPATRGRQAGSGEDGATPKEDLALTWSSNSWARSG